MGRWVSVGFGVFVWLVGCLAAMVVVVGQLIEYVRVSVSLSVFRLFVCLFVSLIDLID